MGVGHVRHLRAIAMFRLFGKRPQFSPSMLSRDGDRASSTDATSPVTGLVNGDAKPFNWQSISIFDSVQRM